MSNLHAMLKKNNIMVTYSRSPWLSHTRGSNQVKVKWLKDVKSYNNGNTLTYLDVPRSSLRSPRLTQPSSDWAPELLVTPPANCGIMENQRDKYSQTTSNNPFPWPFSIAILLYSTQTGLQNYIIVIKWVCVWENMVRYTPTLQFQEWTYWF